MKRTSRDAPARQCLRPRSETDITPVFGTGIRGSNPLEGIGTGRRVGRRIPGSNPGGGTKLDFVIFCGGKQRFARRAVRGNPISPYEAARCAAELVGKKSESLILVRLFDEIRTYFERN